MVVVWQRLCHGDGGGGALAVKVTMVSEWWMWWCRGDVNGGSCWLAVGRSLVARKLSRKKGGSGAKVEGDGVDVMMAAGWGEAGDAAVYDDGGRQQVAGVWSDSGDGAGIISERVCVCVRL
ncbi:hypothetical protein Tco_0280275 [Tanacetum coccineum]